jgi:hypothetical protein
MIVCLQEMKLSSISGQVVAETLGMNFDRFEYLPSLQGLQATYIEVLQPATKVFSLSLTVRPRWLRYSFLLSTVYGPSEDDAKPAFLNELGCIKPTGLIPWIVTGDFNLIYKAKDKNNLNLNRRFTWSSERAVPTMVSLDSVFCNKDWELNFPDYTL